MANEVSTSSRMLWAIPSTQAMRKIVFKRDGIIIETGHKPLGVSSHLQNCWASTKRHHWVKCFLRTTRGHCRRGKGKQGLPLLVLTHLRTTWQQEHLLSRVHGHVYLKVSWLLDVRQIAPKFRFQKGAIKNQTGYSCEPITPNQLEICHL